MRSLRSLREKQNAIIFISRKGRKGRSISKANYAAAGVVARYGRQRTQRQTETETIPPLWDLPCLRGGKLMANAITLFLPLRQAGVPRRGGEGVDITDLRSLMSEGDCLA